MTLLKKITNFDISITTYPKIHPKTKNTQTNLLNLKHKINTETNHTITQFFFDIENYLHFHNHYISTNIDIKIIPKILPISNFKQTKKFTDITNIHIPT